MPKPSKNAQKHQQKHKRTAKKNDPLIHTHWDTLVDATLTPTSASKTKRNKLSWECHTRRYKLRWIYNSIGAKYGGHRTKKCILGGGTLYILCWWGVQLGRRINIYTWRGDIAHYVDGGNNWAWDTAQRWKNKVGWRLACWLVGWLSQWL